MTLLVATLIRCNIAIDISQALLGTESSMPFQLFLRRNKRLTVWLLLFTCIERTCLHCQTNLDVFVTKQSTQTVSDIYDRGCLFYFNYIRLRMQSGTTNMDHNIFCYTNRLCFLFFLCFVSHDMTKYYTSTVQYFSTCHVDNSGSFICPFACSSVYIFGGFNGVMLNDVVQLYTPNCTQLTSHTACEQAGMLQNNSNHNLCEWSPSLGL